jgi:hypothetical protein
MIHTPCGVRELNRRSTLLERPPNAPRIEACPNLPIPKLSYPDARWFRGTSGSYMVSRRFKWKKLPIGMQIELSRACDLDEAAASDADVEVKTQLPSWKTG